MHVLLSTVSLDLEQGAGTAERTRQLAVHLTKRGCSCSLIAMDGQSWAREFGDAGIDAWVPGSIGQRFRIPTVNPLRLWAMIRAASVVHVTGYWNLLSALMCFGARVAGKPYVLCAAGEFANLDAPRPILSLFHRLVGKTMITHASFLIAITELERAETLARLGGMTPPIIVIPNGIDPPPQEADAVAPRPALPDRNFVLFIGRLAPIKGPDLLLRAFASVAPRFPDVDLVLAGPDAGMGSQLRSAAADLGLTSRVHVVGFVNERQRLHVYRRALLLAVPSRSEAMSLVALEAAACGTPVMLTDRCGFDAVADAGGLIVRANENALASGLLRLLSDPEDLAQRGARLREFVLDRYAWTTVVDRLLAHLSVLTGESPAGTTDRMQAASPANTKAR